MTPNSRRILIALILVAVLAALFLGMMISWQQLTGKEDPFAELDLPILLAIIVYTIASYLLVIRVGIGKWGHLTLSDLKWLGPDPARDVVIGVIGALLASALFFSLGWVFELWSLGSFLATSTARDGPLVPHRLWRPAPQDTSGCVFRGEV